MSGKAAGTGVVTTVPLKILLLTGSTVKSIRMVSPILKACVVVSVSVSLSRKVEFSKLFASIKGSISELSVNLT